MARYIDAEALEKEIESLQIILCIARHSGKELLGNFATEYKKSILKIIDEQPPADVVPKREVERLVQDVTRLEQEKDALIKNYSECMKDYAGGIFEEIERTCVSSFGCFYIGATHGAFAELKKKYTEEFYETKDSHESL